MISVDNIMKGKQIGYEELRDIRNEKIWFSIAVQKWNNKYKIYLSEIQEIRMPYYEDIADEVEKIIVVDTIEEVLHYFSDVIEFDIEKLHPLRGQKIFNPDF